MQAKGGDEHDASMSALISGLRDHLTTCAPLNGNVKPAAGATGVKKSSEGDGEMAPPPHILPVVSTTSFDTMMDVKMTQKRARGTAGCVVVHRRRGKGGEENLNWFSSPCEYGLSTDRKTDEGRGGGRSRSRSRSRSTGGPPRSLLEASRVEHRTVERTSSRSRPSRPRMKVNTVDGSVTSGTGTKSTASYARDLYSTTSLGSKIDKATRSKSPTIVTFEPSVARSTRRSRKKRPPAVPRPETRQPTKLHGLVMELSSLRNTSSSNKAAALWKPVSQRIHVRPKEASCLDRRCRSPLSLACEFGNDVPVDVIKSLIEAHPKALSVPDRKGSYPIHYYMSSDRGGAWKRSAELVNIIVDAYPDGALRTNRMGQTPLLAAMQSTPSCLHGVTRENMGNKSEEYDARAAMLTAMYECNPLAASIPDKTYSFPLHYASKKGPNQTLLRELIHQCPAALAARDNFGATPLLLAVHWDVDLDVLRVLVQACPSAVSVRDERGETPLMHAWNSLVHANRARSREDRSRTNVARRAINEARSLRSLDKTPEVRDRWRKIELLLRASYHDAGDVSAEDSAAPPRGCSRWRPVHATCGSAVPPELVRFVMQLFPGEAGAPDDEGKLPLHIAAGVPGYIRLPFERRRSKKKMSAEAAGSGGVESAKQPKQQQSLLGHLLHEHPKGASTMDHTGRLPLHYAARAGRAWLATPEEGGEGGVEELVTAEPRAVRTRDETNGFYPFMYLAMRDDQRGPHRSYKERRARAAQSARRFQPSPEESNVTSEQEWQVKLHEMLEREEVQEMDTLYRLIRAAPDIMVRGTLLPNGGERSKEAQGSEAESRVEREQPRSKTVIERDHAPAFVNTYPPESPDNEKGQAQIDKYALAQPEREKNPNKFSHKGRAEGTTRRKEESLRSTPRGVSKPPRFQEQQIVE